ncbi:MAG: thiamine phosphate synthase [Myxococcota bacterium]
MLDGIYPILDVGPRLSPDRAPALLEDLIAGGATVVQLRAKALPSGPLLALAQALAARAREAGVELIINDRPDVALLAGAAGVHLGQSDLPAPLVRRMLPRPAIVGVSCHSITELVAAKAEAAADYFGFGPVYSTASKVDPEPVVGLENLALAVKVAHPVPVVAIGGIDGERLAEVRRTGARAAAMISAIASAPDPKAATAALCLRWRESE